MESTPQNATLDPENLGILMDFVKSENLPTQNFKADDVILDENKPNEHLYVVLKGTTELTRESKIPNQRKIFVDLLGPGSFLGLISFWSGRPTHSKSQAVDDVTCLVFTATSFDRVRERFSAFSKTVDHLLIGNLCERVQRMASLNAENAELSMALELERNQLKQTLRELNDTRERLAHSERLAVMGQLVAGIAHEINNPAAALRQSIEGIEATSRSSFFSDAKLSLDSELRTVLYEQGIRVNQPDSVTARKRLKELEKEFPEFQRSLLRRLSLLPIDQVKVLEKILKKGHKSGKIEPIKEALGSFEMGAYLKTAHLTTERIFALVKSLKRYGKHESTSIDDIDINQCIRDTRMVLNHRLRCFNLEMNLEDLPKVRIPPGEFNQVITNLLVNAMDATPDGGHITVSTRHAAPKLQVSVSDTGSGIAPENITRLFEPNFTTKNSSKHFGLGLGLALSREIIEQYGGTIVATNNENQGACFTIELPESPPERPGK